MCGCSRLAQYRRIVGERHSERRIRCKGTGHSLDRKAQSAPGLVFARGNTSRRGAIIVPDFPDEEGVRRLFADSKAVEQDFYRRTGIFPTSHAITFHKNYLEKYPTAAREMFNACYAAKQLALRDDADATYSNFAWNRQVWEEQRAVMGHDPWKYGIKGNEKVLNTIIRYAGEQGLLKNKVTIEDLFVQIDEPQS